MQHMKSERHLKNEQKLNLGSSLGQSQTPVKASGNAVTEDIQMCCHVCNVVFTGSETRADHLAGKRHKKAIEAREIMLAFSQNTSTVCSRGSQLLVDVCDAPLATSTTVQNEPSIERSSVSVSPASSSSQAPKQMSPDISAGVDPSLRDVTFIDEGSGIQKVVVRHAEGYGCKPCGILLFTDLAAALEHHETDSHSRKALQSM